MDSINIQGYNWWESPLVLHLLVQWIFSFNIFKSKSFIFVYIDSCARNSKKRNRNLKSHTCCSYLFTALAVNHIDNETGKARHPFLIPFFYEIKIRYWNCARDMVNQGYRLNQEKDDDKYYQIIFNMQQLTDQTRKCYFLCKEPRNINGTTVARYPR